MTCVGGFEFPEDLYYLVEKHLWARPLGSGLWRIGLTPVAYHLLGDTLVAITPRAGVRNVQVEAGRSLAMVESLKYVGPLGAPFDGAVEAFNDLLAASPGAAPADPYGAGWVVEMRAARPVDAAAHLLCGEPARRTYAALLHQQGISLPGAPGPTGAGAPDP
jgi:glycine cleavage system H protein